MMAGRVFFEQGRLGRSVGLSLCVLAVAIAVTGEYMEFYWIALAYLLAGCLGEAGGGRGASGSAGGAVKALAAALAWAEWRPVLVVALLAAVGAEIALFRAEHDFLEELSALLKAEEKSLEELNALLAWRDGIDVWRDEIANAACGVGLLAAVFSGVVDGFWAGSIARMRGVKPWDVLGDFRGWLEWRRETVRRRRIYWLGEREVGGE